MHPSQVEYGVNVNTRVPIIFPDRYAAGDVLRLAERVEALGYDSVWVGDNFFAKSRMESVTTLAAIAARTSRVRLGTSAFILPLRHTVWLSIAWATLDQIARGRTILNVCVGGGGSRLGGPQFAVEFEVAGTPYQKRGEMMEEQIALLRHLWSGDGQPFHGKFHIVPAIRIAPLPVQRPSPPIWISNNPQIVEEIEPKIVERMLRRVAISADGWMTALATPDEYRQLWNRILAYARQVGRDPETIKGAYQMTLTIADTATSAEVEGLEYINRYYGTSYTSLKNSMWGRDPHGTPEDCLGAIRSLMAAGVSSFTFRFASPDQLAQVERFSQQVLPALRSAT